MSSPPIATQLKRLREATRPKLTIRATAEALGMPSGTYAAYEDINKFKKKLLPVDLAKQLADLFEPNGIDRSELLSLAGLTPDGAIEPQADDIADRLDAVMLPEVEVSYSMGGGSTIDDWPIVRMVPFSRSWLRGLTNSHARDLMVARGDGDSMMPTILDQDLVIIDRSQTAIRQQDRIWALAYGDVGMIKRVRALPGGVYQVNSDNPAVTPIIATDGELVTIGRVVGIVRRI